MGTQTYTVQKVEREICFLRLDFETFSIQGLMNTDESEIECPTDKFEVTIAGGTQIPVLCGENSGQHSN